MSGPGEASGQDVGSQRADSSNDILWAKVGRRDVTTRTRDMWEAVTTWNGWGNSVNAWTYQREGYEHLFDWFLRRNPGQPIFMAMLKRRWAWSWVANRSGVVVTVRSEEIVPLRWEDARTGRDYGYRGFNPKDLVFLPSEESEKDKGAALCCVTRKREVSRFDIWGFRSIQSDLMLKASMRNDQEYAALKRGVAVSADRYFRDGLIDCPHLVLGACPGGVGPDTWSEILFVTLGPEGHTVFLSLSTLFLSKLRTAHPEIDLLLK